MTKESLLDEYAKYAWECDESEHVIPYRKSEKAMGEYAKQQAIAFCEWYCSLRYLPKVKNIEDHKPGEKSYMKSYDQLYNEFIEQQNKNNDSSKGID